MSGPSVASTVPLYGASPLFSSPPALGLHVLATLCWDGDAGVSPVPSLVSACGLGFLCHGGSVLTPGL